MPSKMTWKITGSGDERPYFKAGGYPGPVHDPAADKRQAGLIRTPSCQRRCCKGFVLIYNMPRQNPASKEPPENSLAIASFQMIAGGEPQRGRQFLLLRFNRGAYTQRGRPSGDIRTVLESTDTVSFHEEGPPSPDQGASPRLPSIRRFSRYTLFIRYSF